MGGGSLLQPILPTGQMSRAKQISLFRVNTVHLPGNEPDDLCGGADADHRAGDPKHKSLKIRSRSRRRNRRRCEQDGELGGVSHQTGAACNPMLTPRQLKLAVPRPPTSFGGASSRVPYQFRGFSEPLSVGHRLIH